VQQPAAADFIGKPDISSIVQNIKTSGSINMNEPAITKYIYHLCFKASKIFWGVIGS